MYSEISAHNWGTIPSSLEQGLGFREQRGHADGEGRQADHSKSSCFTCSNRLEATCNQRKYSLTSSSAVYDAPTCGRDSKSRYHSVIALSIYFS